VPQPNRWQWAVLWTACAWTVLALILAEDYLVRAGFGGWMVAALAYWQLSQTTTPPGTPDNALSDAPQRGAPNRCLPAGGVFKPIFIRHIDCKVERPLAALEGSLMQPRITADDVT
jgi:hypothetical protein